jgi:uncharacterized protein
MIALDIDPPPIEEPVVLPRRSPMHTPRGPTFRELSRHECDLLLARNHVGRLAFAVHDRVDIQPIHYVYEPGWLFGRTSEGSKLVTLAHSHWVAFEVDEVRGVFDWSSVVVHGTFHRIDPQGSPRDQAASARAVHLLREIIPETFERDDPAAFRTVLFRIAVGEVTGRAASPESRHPADAAPADRARPLESAPLAPPNLSGW